MGELLKRSHANCCVRSTPYYLDDRIRSTSTTLILRRNDGGKPTGFSCSIHRRPAAKASSKSSIISLRCLPLVLHSSVFPNRKQPTLQSVPFDGVCHNIRGWKRSQAAIHQRQPALWSSFGYVLCSRNSCPKLATETRGPLQVVVQCLWWSHAGSEQKRLCAEG